MQILNSVCKKSLLDPRTKMLLLSCVSVFVLGNAGGDSAAEFRVALNYLPLLLLIASRRWGIFAYAVFLYTVAYGLACLVMPHCTGLLCYLTLAFSGIILRFLPGILTGMYVVSTTTVSEFICAMEKIHVPDAITIPLSVMFRFFPTVTEEARFINRAMAMRDIRFGGTKVFQMLEYRLIPLMTCSLKIGQELSAASLTRGLGGPDRRTNICKIGFGFWDFVTFILLGAGIAFTVLRAIKII